MNKKVLIIGVTIVATVILWLAFTFYSAVSGTGTLSTYYITVGELKAKGPEIYGRTVRVAGRVVEGTIQWDPQNLLLTFEIADESGSLPVVYHGPRPDMLRDGAEAVVEGHYTPEGIFEVNPKGLMLKCPSKYEEETQP